MANNSYIWQPKYVGIFQCDGIKCHAKCCKKWVINIDERSLQKYQRIKNTDMQKKILSSIIKQENINSHIIKLDNDGACPLICSDSLCYIQRNLGETYLSETCRIYPRKLNVMKNFHLRSLSMTCPIAAEAALFTNDGMSMQKLEHHHEMNGGWILLSKAKAPKFPYSGDLAESIILGALSILQNDSYTREVRFILLGLFLDKADELKDESDATEQIAKLALTYQSMECKKDISSFLVSFNFHVAENEIFMHSLLTLLSEEKQLGDISDLLKSTDRYNNEYQLWHGLLEHIYGKALDNYWVQEFIYHAYPFYVEGSFLHNYFIYLVSYKVWEIILYNFRKGIGEIIGHEEFIMLVNTYTSIMDHKRQFLHIIEQKAAECEAEPVKAMQMLLRLK